MSGVELQIYLTRGLGLEGYIHQYRSSIAENSDHRILGGSGEALGFFEIGILRLQAVGL